MIEAIVAPIIIAAMDAVLWWRIDGILSRAPFPPLRWRVHPRRWPVWAAAYVWVVLVAWSGGHPWGVQKALADGVFLGAMIAIVIWWLAAIYRDVKG